MIKIKKQTPIVILFTLILAWAANNLTIRIVAALASTVGETTKSTIFYATILLTIAALSDKRRVISPENIFIVFYIFFYIVGLIYHTSTFPGIISSEATTLIVLGLPAGLLGIKLSKITASKTNNQSKTYRIKKTRILAIFFCITATAIAITWYIRIGTIPILAEDIEKARITLAEGTFRHRQAISIFVPFFLLYLITAISQEKVSNRDKATIIICFITGSFLLLSQGFRTFMLGFWMICLFSAYKSKRSIVSKKRLVIAFIIITTAIFGFNIIRYSSAELNIGSDKSDIEIAMTNLVVRPVAAQETLDYFPKIVPHEGFNTYIRGLGFILPTSDKGVGIWLKEDVFGKEFAGGGYNPGIIGEIIIAFGKNFVVFVMIIYGYTIGKLFNLTPSTNKTLNTAASSTVFFYALIAISPGISNSIMPITWYSAILILAHFLSKSRGRR